MTPNGSLQTVVDPDERQFFDDYDESEDDDRTCQACQGTGQEWDLLDCEACDGEGYRWWE